MIAHRYLTYGGKIATVAIAGVAVLVASLLAATYAVALCGSSLRGVAIDVVFGGVALAIVGTLGFVLIRLSWSLRALMGVTLLVVSFLLLPRPTCAAEPQTTTDCQ